MSVEHRRTERIVDYLPIEVRAVRQSDGQPLAGPFSGSIIDISKHGACLLMTQVFHNGFHLFHSTRDTNDTVLQLTLDHPPELNHCTLIAVPIWMDIFRHQEIRAFKMGVEFRENPEANQMKELQKALKKNRKKRAGWWLKHYKRWKENR